MKNSLIALSFALFIFTLNGFSQDSSSTLITRIQSETGYVVLNEDYNNCIRINKIDTLQLEPGKNTLKFLQSDFRDNSINIDLKVGEIKRNSLIATYIKDLSKRKKYSSYAQCFWKTNVIVLTDHDSKITVNNQDLGTENISLSLPDSTYTLFIENEGTVIKKKFKVSNDFQTIEKFLRPEKSTVYRRSFVPGYAQYTKREKLKGTIFFGASAALTFSTVFSVIKATQEKQNFEQLRTEYRSSSDPSRILEIIDESEESLESIDKFHRIRNYSLIGFGLVYGLNIFDGIKPPKLGFRSNRVYVNPYVDFDEDLIPRANIKLDF